MISSESLEDKEKMDESYELTEKEQIFNPSINLKISD